MKKKHASLRRIFQAIPGSSSPLSLIMQTDTLIGETQRSPSQFTSPAKNIPSKWSVFCWWVYCIFHPFKTAHVVKENIRLGNDMDDLLSKELTISDILIRNNGVTVEGGSEMVKYLVLTFKKMLDEHHAVNYLEMQLHYGKDPAYRFGNDFIVTVQRAEKPTPHELRKAADKEVARLKALLQSYGHEDPVNAT